MSAPHGEHPPLEVDVVDVFRLAVDGLERGVLHKVVGIVAVACQHHGEIAELGLKAQQVIYKCIVMCSHIVNNFMFSTYKHRTRPECPPIYTFLRFITKCVRKSVKYICRR